MIEFVGDDFGFEVEFGPAESCQVSGVAHEITARGEGNSIAEKEEYLKFTVKWDGCSHWNFGEGGDGYMHACEARHLEKHCQLLQFIYGRAFELMKQAGVYIDGPGEGWEWMREKKG